MLKIIYFLSKRPSMSSDEFVRYWQENHVPLVMRLPGLRRYRINSLSGSPPAIPTEAGPPDTDGIAELFYDDMKAFRRTQASPEMAAAEADVPRFTSAVTAVFADEITLIE